MKKYKGYLSDPFDSIEEFAHHRVMMGAALIGGAMDPAIDYNWTVSENDGESYWRPDEIDRQDLFEAVWAVRGEAVNCVEHCYRREQVEGFWQCLACRAIWTGNDDESLAYGVRLTDKELTARMKEMLRANPTAFDYQREARRKNFRSAFRNLRSIRSRDPDPIDGWRSAVIDVKIGGWGFFSFLVVSTDEYGTMWNRWL